MAQHKGNVNHWKVKVMPLVSLTVLSLGKKTCILWKLVYQKLTHYFVQTSGKQGFYETKFKSTDALFKVYVFLR